jgi:hypothetical protein
MKQRPLTPQEARALDRAARTAILGIAHLKTDPHPRNRPPTIDAALRRDEIAQWVAIMRALHPEWPEKEIRARICKYYGVKRSFYYKVLTGVDPERWKNMQGLAAAFAEMCRDDFSTSATSVDSFPTSVDSFPTDSG